MGIKNLNSFLKMNCSNSIHRISISEICGKKIAVDISIYIYKFEGDNSLIEQLYLMLSIFRYYNIIPIFIFDGKPPIEKKNIMKKRKSDKNEAEKEYNLLRENLMINQNMDEIDKQELISNMDILKKKFIYINKEKIKKVKELIRLFGMSYCDAPGEADELCAFLVNKKKVWGCLSEDMDMFVYGCSRVLRYISLLNHTVVLYNTKDILEELGINQKEFRQICVLSGTDYNYEINNEIVNTLTLNNTLKYFKKYNKTKKEIDFYKWLIEKGDYIQNYDILNDIYSIFDLSHERHNALKIFEKIQIENTQMMKNDIRLILEEDGFIF